MRAREKLNSVAAGLDTIAHELGGAIDQVRLQEVAMEMIDVALLHAHEARLLTDEEQLVEIIGLEAFAGELADAFNRQRSHDGQTLNLTWDQRTAEGKRAWVEVARVAIIRVKWAEAVASG